MKSKRMLEKIEGDFTSGSLQLAIMAAEALMVYLQEKQKDWRRDLPAFCSELAESKPAMASLYNIANQTLTEANRKSTTKKALLDLLGDISSALKDSVRKIGKNGISLISKNSILLTHSRSATVFSVIQEGVQREKVREVVVTQSYPLGEGITFSREIEELGVETRLIPDSAIGSLMPICDCVLIGADALTEKFLVNKVGSLLLALAAQHSKKPFYCAVDTFKFVPSRVYKKMTGPPIGEAGTNVYPTSKTDKNVSPTTEGTDRNVCHPTKETGPPTGPLRQSESEASEAGKNVNPPEGIFEAVPLSLVTRIITEDGIQEPSKVRDHFRKHKIVM
jgi:translation initiation factor 2B subunit (eIF-2B alpha/beta/delta family)